MSLRRRYHGPVDVIPHVWRCHCRPERALSKSVHWLRPVEGRFATDSACPRPDLRLPDKTQTHVHPPTAWDVLRFGGPCKGLPSAPPHRRPCSPFARTIDGAHLRRQASPVRGCAQAALGRTRTGAKRHTGTVFRASAAVRPALDAPIDKVQFSKLALSTSARFLRLHFCNFQSCDCPVEVEGTPESDCLL